MKLTKILAAAAVVAFMISAMPGDEVISKDNDTTIVNTTSLSKGVRGFKGATPVKIYIKKNKVVKIEALRNRETPAYLNMAKTLLTKYEGKTVKKAASMDVDGVSGATYTSKALKKNVQLGLVVFHGDHGGLDGILSLLLLVVKVGDGGAVGALAQTGDRLGVEEHALAEGGFAVAAVTQQGDVADILRSVHV